LRQVVESVTGLDYRAWKMGPVPLELMQEWEDLETDLAKAIDIILAPVSICARAVSTRRLSTAFAGDIPTSPGQLSPSYWAIASTKERRLLPTVLDISEEQG
jgi:hypothetical protein